MSTVASYSLAKCNKTLKIVVCENPRISYISEICKTNSSGTNNIFFNKERDGVVHQCCYCAICVRVLCVYSGKANWVLEGAEDALAKA